MVKTERQKEMTGSAAAEEAMARVRRSLASADGDDPRLSHTEDKYEPDASDDGDSGAKVPEDGTPGSANADPPKLTGTADSKNTTGRTGSDGLTAADIALETLRDRTANTEISL